MRLFIIGAALATLVACAPAHPPAYTPYSPAPAALSAPPAGLTQSRSALLEKKQRLEVARQQEEIDQLNKEIQELEARIAELERQAEPSKSAETRTPTGANGAVRTGPRGGRYTISPSGKKQYIRRK